MKQIKPQRASVRVEVGTSCIRIKSARVQYKSVSQNGSVRYRVHLAPSEIDGKRNIGSRKAKFIAYLLEDQTQFSFQRCHEAIIEASNGNDKPLYDLLRSSNAVNEDMVFGVTPPKRIDSLTNFLQP